MQDPTQIRVECFTGEAIARQVPGLARLRIEVFRDYPYLYAGDLAYEARYLQTYVDSPRSLIVTVFDRDRVVGASSAVPLADEMDEIRQPLADAGYPVDRFFYCGESVLLPEYRGLGLGKRFFDERERHARSLGGFEWIGFCAVDRPPDHPRRPDGYRPLDEFWARRGYQRQSGLQASLAWLDLDDAEETRKTLTFWVRRL